MKKIEKVDMEAKALIEKTRVRRVRSVKKEIKKLLDKHLDSPTPKKPTTEIFEYIRRRKGGKSIKAGVVFGLLNNEGTIKIGWSKCNIKEDKFNPEDGLALAKHRALGVKKSPAIPLCLKSQIRQFASRSVRYFQDFKRLEMPE